MTSLRTSAVRGAALAVSVFILCSSLGRAQETPAAAAPPPSGEPAIRDLQDQVRQLRSLVEEMRAENAQSRAEMHQLRQDLQSTRALLERPAASGGAENAETATIPAPGTAAAPAVQGSAPIEERVQKLEESTSLIGSKIDEQYQTKVESASKYRARLHGIVLMNAFRNVGGSDDLDFPNYSQLVSPGSPQVTLGATLRQSEIGFEIFGPNIGGARTSADVQLDFAGGFARTGNGVDFGIVRVQNANLRFDWEKTSIVAGQDSLFISPFSPTSFASLATPAFAFAGNLWGWTPQVRVEHRFAFSDQQTLTLQAGVLDNLDWEYPTIRSTVPRKREKCPDSLPMPSAQHGRVRCGNIHSVSALQDTTAARTGRGTVTSTRGPEWQIGRFLSSRVSVSRVSFTAVAALAGSAAPLEPPSCTEVTRPRPSARFALWTLQADGAN